MNTYHLVCVAGTFDRLHAGHDALLSKAFEVGTHVLIGLTSDAYVSAYKVSKTGIKPYSLRKQGLEQWLHAKRVQYRATIVAIDDPFEPAVSSKDIDALIVTEETMFRAKELNEKRMARGLQHLTLIVAPMIPAEDRKLISSTRVREGEIDTHGNLVMPDSLRIALARPSGRVLSTPEMIQESFDIHRKDSVVSVGDLTTKTVLDAGITPRLMIIDNKVEREDFFALQPIIRQKEFHVYKVRSGPGYISVEAIVCIHTLLSVEPQGSSVIEVDGEEDLLALPVMAEAPLGFVMYYGQPGAGIVEVVVTDKTKEAAKKLLQQFIS